MSVFLHILGNNIVPIFVLIALGFIASKKFNFDVRTLSKIIIYLFTPAFIFVNIYTADLDLSMLKVFIFGITYFVINDLLSRGIAKVRNYDNGFTNAFKNAIMFNNSGNIGLSLITLVFSSAPYIIDGNAPYLNEAVSVQIIVIVCMNLGINTVGFYNAGRASMNFKDTIKTIFKLPSLYIIPTVIFLRYFHIDVTTTLIWPALDYLKNGMVAISLITLGAQLSKTELSFRDIDVHIAVFSRLVLGPIIAYVMIRMIGFSGIIAQSIFIAYAVPSAVNTSLIAIEFNNHKEFASQAIMISTIFSAVTLTFAIYGARVLFPV